MTYVPNLQVWFEPYQMRYLYSKFGKHRNAITNMASELWKIEINDQNSHLDGISGKCHFFFYNNVAKYHFFLNNRSCNI